MENRESESRIESPNPCQRRYAGRMENGESESRTESPDPVPKKVCWENGEWRVRNQTRGGSHGKNLQNQNLVKLEQKRESELPNWVRLDHHSSARLVWCVSSCRAAFAFLFVSVASPLPLLSARCARAGRSAPCARCSGTVPAAPRAARCASGSSSCCTAHRASPHDCHCFPQCIYPTEETRPHSTRTARAQPPQPQRHTAAPAGTAAPSRQARGRSAPRAALRAVSDAQHRRSMRRAIAPSPPLTVHSPPRLREYASVDMFRDRLSPRCFTTKPKKLA